MALSDSALHDCRTEPMNSGALRDNAVLCCHCPAQPGTALSCLTAIGWRDTDMPDSAAGARRCDTCHGATLHGKTANASRDTAMHGRPMWCMAAKVGLGIPRLSAEIRDCP